MDEDFWRILETEFVYVLLRSEAKNVLKLLRKTGGDFPDSRFVPPYLTEQEINDSAMAKLRNASDGFSQEAIKLRIYGYEAVAIATALSGKSKKWSDFFLGAPMYLIGKCWSRFLFTYRKYVSRKEAKKQLDQMACWVSEAK